MYPRKFNQFMCKLDNLIAESQVVSNTLNLFIENCKSEDYFLNLKDKVAFENEFPDLRFLTTTAFPDVKEDKDKFICKVLVHIFSAISFSTSFQNDFDKLLCNMVFQDSPIMPFLKKASRLNAPWESDLKTLESLSASLLCLLTYLKELQQNLSKRFKDLFQLHELFDQLISYDFLLYPSTLRSSMPITSNIFFKKLEQFHFFS